ncbi:hypothetical protein OEA41_007942 [Lepraria neglecta]|uniref:MFS general substrate transporter n=1 Tax=Lepraria neglecta TaxID=209136 RepID=A0AAD9ZH97_9LECA|nr:hypothetical protein OEA41_007942 [Lepraria neglecta]
METALQVDLAKPEAPAEQVLESALGQIPSQSTLARDKSPSHRPSNNEKQPIRGRSETTNQVRLGPKYSQGRRSRSVSTQGVSNEAPENGHFDETTNAYTLQPVDEGFGAWSYVASAFAMFIVVWGFPQSFPIFQTYLSTGESAKHTDSVILAFLAPGLQDIEEGIMFQILPKAARHRRTLVLVGISIMMLSLLLASCAAEAWQIVLTQGILYGIGGIFLNFVHVSIFSEWFDKKKGQAMGLIWLGYRVGGLASGGFRNCLFSFYSEVSGQNSELFTAIHSLFSFFDGVAILSVGPVGTALLKLSPELEIGAYAIGRYKAVVMPQLRATFTDAYDNNAMELGSIRRVPSIPFLDEGASGPSSLRSSLDSSYCKCQGCDVHIYDDAPAAPSESPARTSQRLNTSSWYGGLGEFEDLKEHLKEIAKIHLGGHKCLDLESRSRQALGGPTDAGDDGKCRHHMASDTDLVRGKTNTYMVLLAADKISNGYLLAHSTIITNFVGPHRLAQEVGSIYVERVLEGHSLGHQTLGCVWLLAFAILRTTAEQLDFAFDIFDPTDAPPSMHNIPQLNDLPEILEKSNRLARIDRYLSGLEEFQSFFSSVRQLLSVEAAPETGDNQLGFRSTDVTKSADFEAARAQEKIQQEQRLCQTYMRQYDTLVQLVISYSATQITERLDAGRKLGEQFAKIGMFLAALAGIVAPMSLLTGFYGMNVKEFVPGTSTTLFEFWQIGIPVLLLTTSCIATTAIWMINNASRVAGKK